MLKNIIIKKSKDQATQTKINVQYLFRETSNQYIRVIENYKKFYKHNLFKTTSTDSEPVKFVNVNTRIFKHQKNDKLRFIAPEPKNNQKVVKSLIVLHNALKRLNSSKNNFMRIVTPAKGGFIALAYNCTGFLPRSHGMALLYKNINRYQKLEEKLALIGTSSIFIGHSLDVQEDMDLTKLKSNIFLMPAYIRVFQARMAFKIKILKKRGLKNFALKQKIKLIFLNKKA